MDPPDAGLTDVLLGGPFAEEDPPAQQQQQQEQQSDGLSASDYVRLINIRTGKILALLLLFSFGLYHGLLHHSVTPCKGLFLDGMYKGDLWQPWGCMMHRYSQGDAERCFKYNGFYGRRTRIVFLGDSRARQIYEAMERLIKDGLDPLDEISVPKTPSLQYENPELNLKLEYIRAPYMNESVLKIMKNWELSELAPTVLILDAATHYIKDYNNSESALSLYEEHLVALKASIEELEPVTKVIWMLQPLVNEQRLHVARKAITSDSIVRYNSAARDVLTNSSAQLWTSMLSFSDPDLSKFPDGLHFNARPQKQASTIILNLLCNDNMNFSDGSCCKGSDRVTKLQIVFFCIIYACASVAVMDFLFRRCSHPRRRSSTNATAASAPASSNGQQSHDHYFYQLLVTPSTAAASGLLNGGGKGNAGSDLGMSASSRGDEGSVAPRTFFQAVARLGIVLSYFYLCDRTNFFMKENKYFTPLNFFLPILYITILGLFFNEEVKGARFLHRDQTDEWKGWMQLVILIYHLTGASRVLPIYMHVRVLVSSYIFLNSYGNFFYMWIKEDTSLHRFLQVLFRMNFLTVVLCFAMNRNYQAYYFVPLITFWYTLQFVVMAIPPKISAKSTELSPIHYWYLVLKIVIVICIITVFHMSEYFFEKFFLARPFKALFVSEDDDIREWWFRWKLDRYSMVYGFIFAYVTALARRFRLIDDSSSGGALWPKAVTTLAVLGCISGLLGYLLFALYCKNKEQCNEVHSYIVFIPIVSFILLRNIFGFLRTRYSSFFAWFGRISLELFVAQYHIWLAADTHGILVLIPNYPNVNTLLTAFVFICVAHEIHLITGILVPFFIPKDFKIILRNLGIFIAILLPVGYYDGMI